MAFDYAGISGPKQRAKVLLRTRNLKMARNAHAYVRGSTVKFYEWLEGRRQEAAGGTVGMDLWRLPSGKSGAPRRRRRPRRRSNSRSRSDRDRKSRPRSRPVGAVAGVSGPRVGSGWRDGGQDAGGDDERLRSGIGRRGRRASGKEPPAETDPRSSSVRFTASGGNWLKSGSRT